MFDGGGVGFWGCVGLGWGWICVGGVGRVLFSESPGAKRKAGRCVRFGRRPKNNSSFPMALLGALLLWCAVGDVLGGLLFENSIVCQVC